MLALKLAPFLLQGLILTIDEWGCHRRRVLRRWERLGHPLDSLSFCASLLFLILVAPSAAARWGYVAISVFSCLFVTKDEWEHGELCSGFENWLHALLFMLHPTLLIWAYSLWWTGDADANAVIAIAAAGSFGYALVQYVTWNWVRRDQQ